MFPAGLTQSASSAELLSGTAVVLINLPQMVMDPPARLSASWVRLLELSFSQFDPVVPQACVFQKPGVRQVAAQLLVSVWLQTPPSQDAPVQAKPSVSVHAVPSGLLGCSQAPVVVLHARSSVHSFASGVHVFV